MAVDYRIQLNNLEKKLGKQASDLIAALVLETQAALVKESPVDEGIFRANWFIGENRPDTRTDRRRRTVKAYGGTFKPGNKYFITNNLPYARRLADGWSKQAPSGWIGLIAASTEARARRLLGGE